MRNFNFFCSLWHSYIILLKLGSKWNNGLNNDINVLSNDNCKKYEIYT